MHDIWNPWHGCKKCSEGCQNCYMRCLCPDGCSARAADAQYAFAALFMSRVLTNSTRVLKKIATYVEKERLTPRWR